MTLLETANEGAADPVRLATPLGRAIGNLFAQALLRKDEIMTVYTPPEGYEDSDHARWFFGELVYVSLL